MSQRYEAPKRINYYDGLFLTADLCSQEQTYFRQQLSYNIAALYSQGIVDGLTVELKGSYINVEPGLAFDGEGNQLIWYNEDYPSIIPEDLLDEDGSIYVYLSTNTNTKSGNYIDETPTVAFDDRSPSSSDKVLLAQLEVKNKQVTGITQTGSKATPKLQALDPTAAVSKETSELTTSKKVKAQSHRQDGVASIAPLSSSSRAYKTLEVTFPSPFEAPPSVQLTLEAKDTDLFLVANIESISSTSFRVRVMRLDGGGYSWESNQLLHWSATSYDGSHAKVENEMARQFSSGSTGEKGEDAKAVDQDSDMGAGDTESAHETQPSQPEQPVVVDPSEQPASTPHPLDMNPDTSSLNPDAAQAAMNASVSTGENASLTHNFMNQVQSLSLSASSLQASVAPERSVQSSLRLVAEPQIVEAAEESSSLADEQTPEQPTKENDPTPSAMANVNDWTVERKIDAALLSLLEVGQWKRKYPNVSEPSKNIESFRVGWWNILLQSKDDCLVAACQSYLQESSHQRSLGDQLHDILPALKQWRDNTPQFQSTIHASSTHQLFRNMAWDPTWCRIQDGYFLAKIQQSLGELDSWLNEAEVRTASGERANSQNVSDLTRGIALDGTVQGIFSLVSSETLKALGGVGKYTSAVQNRAAASSSQEMSYMQAYLQVYQAVLNETKPSDLYRYEAWSWLVNNQQNRFQYGMKVFWPKWQSGKGKTFTLTKKLIYTPSTLLA